VPGRGRGRGGRAGARGAELLRRGRPPRPPASLPPRPDTRGGARPPAPVPPDCAVRGPGHPPPLPRRPLTAAPGQLAAHDAGGQEVAFGEALRGKVVLVVNVASL